MTELSVLDLVARAKDEATATLTRVDAAMGKLGTTATESERRSTGLGAALGSIASPAVAATIAIGATTAIMGRAIEAAIDNEKSVAALSQSLRASIPAWDGNTAAIEQTIQSRMRLGFTDEEQRASLARLVAVTHDSAKALELERVAMDLAAFKRVDLDTATVALINTEGGRYRQLGQLIGSTKEITSSEQALAAVHATTTGAAEALANTTGGQLQAANVKLNEAMERLGTTLLPAVAAAMGFVADAVEAGVTSFENLLSPLARANDLIGAAGQAWSDLHVRIPGVADAIDGVTGAFNANTSALDDATKATLDHGDATTLQTGAINSLNDAVISVTSSIITLYGTSKDAADAATKHRLELYGEQGAALSAAQGMVALHGATASVVDTSPAFVGALSAEAAAADNLAFRAAVAARNIAAALGSATAVDKRLRQLGEAPGAGVSGSLQLGGITSGLGGYYQPPALPTVPKTPKGKGGGGGKSAADKAAADAKAAAEAAAKAIDDMYEKAGKAGDEYFDKIHDRNMRQIDDAHKVANEKIKAEREASKETLRLALDAIDKELAAKKRANAEPVTQLEASQAAVEAAQQLRDLQEQLAQAQAGGDQKAIRDATEALQNFQAHQQIDAARAAQDAADAAAEAAAEAARAAAQEAEAKRQADLDARQAAEDKKYDERAAAEDKRWEEQRRKFDEQIIAQEKNTKATLAAATAMTQLYLLDQLKLAKESGTAQEVVAAQQALDKFRAANPRAGGGPVLPGRSYIVGERAPELFIPDVAGAIAPLTGGPIHITVNGAGDPDAVADRVFLRLRREVDRQGSSLVPQGVFARGA